MELRKLEITPRLTAKKGADLIALKTILMISNIFITRVRNIRKSGFD